MTANPDKMRKAREIIQQGIDGVEIKPVSQQVQPDNEYDIESLETRIQRLENALNKSAVDHDKECNCECPQ